MDRRAARRSVRLCSAVCGESPVPPPGFGPSKGVGVDPGPATIIAAFFFRIATPTKKQRKTSPSGDPSPRPEHYSTPQQDEGKVGAQSNPRGVTQPRI